MPEETHREKEVLYELLQAYGEPETTQPPECEYSWGQT